MSAAPNDVAISLAHVRDRISRACQRAGRNSDSVRLIAVSKHHPVSAIEAAYAAGQHEFGENYVQELLTKADALGALAGLRWRMIGHLQRNKVKDIVRAVPAIDTVDSVRLAKALSDKAQKYGVGMDVMIQVNVAREPQKAGVLPDVVPEIVDAVHAMPGLRLTGLMTIPPETSDPETSRPHFARLRNLAERHGLAELSMGMSADLEAAVLEGSTMVRVGTAIFGARSSG